MDKTRSEIFGRFDYDDSLTYDELLSLEDSLIAATEDLLTRGGVSHLDFTPQGDALMFQGAFEEHKTYIYRKIAQEIAALIPQGVTVRVLCVDKGIDAVLMYWIRPRQFQEQETLLPGEAPEGLKVWSVATEEKALEVSDVPAPSPRVPGWWNW